MESHQIKEEQQFDEETVSLQAEKILYTVAFPMVLKAALELGVIDTIASVDEGVWLSSSEIALRLPTKPTNPEAPVLLDRMLVLLASHSILKCRTSENEENGQTGKTERLYAAEPVCMFFMNNIDGSGSLASMFMLVLSEVYFKTWTHLKDVILEGKDAFSSAHGMSIFDYIGSNKQFAKMFNRAMSEASTLSMTKILEVYKGFEDVKTLVDVGGGVGTIIGLVTSKYPHIKGINFDLASVLANAPLYPGVEHVSGDMFTEIPKGDAIFMKVSSVEKDQYLQTTFRCQRINTQVLMVSLSLLLMERCLFSRSEVQGRILGFSLHWMRCVEMRVSLVVCEVLEIVVVISKNFR